MNKNTIIGIALMVVLFIGYGVYQVNVSEKQAEQQAKYEQQQAAKEAAKVAEEEAARKAEEAMTAEERFLRDSTIAANAELGRLNLHGATLLTALEGESVPYTYENDYIAVTFDNKGGLISDVELKEHFKYAEGERTERVKMMVPGTAAFGMKLKHEGSAENLNSGDYYFVPQVDTLENGKGCRVAMKLQLDAESYVEYVYTIHNTGNPSRDYLVDFTLNQQGLDKWLVSKDKIAINWSNKSVKNERNFATENMATTIAYCEHKGGEVDEIDADGGKEKLTDLDWIALKQQYFTSAFIAKEPINGTVRFGTSEQAGKDYVKSFKTDISVPFSADEESYKFAFYYGPNDFTIMKDVKFAGKETHLEDVIPMGGWIIGWVNRFLTIPVFQWLKSYGLSFGLIILILTIMVKLLILPLTYKSYMSTAKMRAVRPELEDINKKYPNPDDAMKKQQATMELYRKAGISPMGGCLPLLIQMPILWAMFRFFPASIELRGQGFLWADDLSAYDSVLDFGFNIPFYGDHVSLFALLMALSLFGYSFMTYKQQSATTAGQPGAGMMKFMMVYFMPFMMLCFMNSYASGLCYYYFVSQILTMLIMFLIRRSVNDDKVRERLLAHASKPRKKSKFQERYEEALRQQQEQLNREQRRQRR